MYVNAMETRVQKEVRDLSRVLAHVLTDCLRGGIPSRLLAATIVPRGHAPVAVRLDEERVTEGRLNTNKKSLRHPGARPAHTDEPTEKTLTSAGVKVQPA
jgi:hypothetical protein